MSSKRLLIFDCDGVLVDSELIVTQTIVSSLFEYGYHITIEEWIKRFAGKTDILIYQEINLELEALRFTPEIIAEIQKQILFTLFAKVRAVKGMKQLLKILQKARECLCVASSGTMDKINTSLQVTDLKRYFSADHYFSAQSVKQGKPAPDLFLFAAKHMGFAPCNCLVIEDSMAGIRAAKNADMKVIGFLGASHTHFPWYQANIKNCGVPTVQNAKELLKCIVDMGDESNVSYFHPQQ